MLSIRQYIAAVRSALGTLRMAIQVERQVRDTSQEVLDRWTAAVYAQYIDDGAIYGDSLDGAHRWLKEVQERERYRALAGSIEARHAMLRVERKIGYPPHKD